MPRRHGPRAGATPLAPLPSGFACLGCGAPVSAVRLCCPRCWNRLPLDLRALLRVPAGENPHQVTSGGQAQAQDAARAYLRRGAELTEAALAREAAR